MAWCMAAAWGGGVSLCNLGVPSVAVSWSCHLVGLTQSPRQHLPTIGASAVPSKYMWHARKLKEWQKCLKTSWFMLSLSLVENDLFSGQREWLTFCDDKWGPHTDRLLFKILYAGNSAAGLFSTMHQPRLSDVCMINKYTLGGAKPLQLSKQRK